jgi:transcriptional regulator with XRE-family HTH domain
MILVRRLLGDVLRQLRLEQGRTLREVSAAARVSLGYISEIERGQKEASSECLAAICSALDVPLSVVLAEVSGEIAREEAAVTGLRPLARQPKPVGATVTDFAA